MTWTRSSAVGSITSPTASTDRAASRLRSSSSNKCCIALSDFVTVLGHCQAGVQSRCHIPIRLLRSRLRSGHSFYSSPVVGGGNPKGRRGKAESEPPEIPMSEPQAFRPRQQSRITALGHGRDPVRPDVRRAALTRCSADGEEAGGDGTLTERVAVVGAACHQRRVGIHTETGRWLRESFPQVLALPSSRWRCCQSSQACPSSCARI